MNEKIYAEFEKRTRGFLPTKPYKLIGIGGTATSLSTIKQELKTYCSEMVHESTISKDELEHIIDSLANKTIKERQNMVGLEAKRADIILAGAFLLLNIFKIKLISCFNKLKISSADCSSSFFFIALPRLA